MNIVTSDWHLDHNNILTYCGRTAFMTDDERRQFDALKRGERNRARIRYSRETIGRMNDAIIDGVNKVAGPNDVVWNLGDAIFYGKDPNKIFARLWGFRKRIRAKRMYLIWGNHDDILDPRNNYQRNAEGVLVEDEEGNYIPKGRQTAFTEDQFRTIFDAGFERHTAFFKGTRFTMDHYANLVWRGNGHGVCMLYGHSHSNLEPWVETHIPRGKLLDVGIDNRARMGLGYTPWTEDELLEYMNNKSGQPVDHHGAK